MNTQHKIYKFLVAGAFASIAPGALSQTLSTEITVDRTVAAEQIQSAPLASVRPSLLPAPSFATTMELADFWGDNMFAGRPGRVNPYLYPGLPKPLPYRGYATLAYFPTYRLWAQAGYSLIDNDNTLLQVSARFGGHSWHTNYNGRDEGPRNTVSTNSFNVDALLYQRLGAHSLRADVDYLGAFERNPAYNGENGNQNYSGVRFNARLDRREDRFAYGARVYVDHFGASEDLQALVAQEKVFSPASNTVVGAELNGRLGGDAIAGVLTMGIASVSRKGDVVNCVVEDWGFGQYGPGIAISPLSHDRNTVFSATLWARHRSDHFDLEAGARVDLASGTDHDKFNIAPQIKLTWLTTDVVRVFVTADGGTTLNTLRERYDRTPMAPAWGVDRLQRVPLRGTAGFSYAPGSGFRAGFEACFQRTIGAPMMLLGESLRPQPGDVESVVYAPINLKGAWFEGNLGYSLPSFYGLDLDARVRLYTNSKPALSIETTDPYDEEWGMPENADRTSFALDFSASAQPLERLSVRLDWQLRTGRKVYDVDHRDGGNYDLSAINNLNVSSLYRFNERLTIGLQLQNLLCKRYFIVPGVRSASLTGLLGATISF